MKKLICLLVLNIGFNCYAKTVVNDDNEIVSPPILDSFTASNITGSTVELSWTPVMDTENIESFIIYSDNTIYTFTSGTTSSFVITRLSPERTYMFRIKTIDTSGNRSDFSTPIYITTTSTVTSYCAASSYSTQYEHIDFVGIGEISNVTSNDGGYRDYTNLVANLSIGVNKIELSAGFADSTYEESFAVWIDFNQNKIFEASEMVVSSAVVVPVRSDIISYDFIVPSVAKLGNTRMRIGLQYDGVPRACNQDFAYGEVEDYTVNIMPFNSKSATSRTRENLQEYKEAKIIVYPNPTQGSLVVEMENYQNSSYSLINQIGQIVKKDKLSNNEIDVQGISPGTYYISIQNNKGKVIRQFVKK